jgi:AraC family transcriptional regulator of adaptative response / DNA-3-methyladenine glycosylase II
VSQLARELGVSDRHLRRVLERELGVSPVELAQTHRLLFAKRLLADTSLPVTRIAYASGFQSLRRFNSVFRDRYRLSPSALRRAPRLSSGAGSAAVRAGDLVKLTLAYRAPLAWDTMIALLGRDVLPGVELVEGRRYARTVRLDGKSGVILAVDSLKPKTQLEVDVSSTLLPVLMPLLARLRHLFDLDAEPTVVDLHLERAGLGGYVGRRPGLRVPGVLDGVEAVLRVVLGDRTGRAASAALPRVVEALGQPFLTGISGLVRLAPDASRLAEAGVDRLAQLGVSRRKAELLVSLAQALTTGTVCLEPGSDVGLAHRALLTIAGVSERLATRIVMHALRWPDAFDASDRAIQRAAGAAGSAELMTLAERWRPWRGYARLHLSLGLSPDGG